MEIIHNINKEKKLSEIDELSNIEAEIALIGCLLKENKFFEKISDFLLPEHFTNPLHSKLFSISISDKQYTSMLFCFSITFSKVDFLNIKVFFSPNFSTRVKAETLDFHMHKNSHP